MSDYCNTTTDLTDLFPKLADLQLKTEIENWVATDGQSLTWEKFGTGEVYNLFEDGKSLTVKTSIASVEAAAASYWYDSDKDILYCHPTGDGNPEDFDLIMGEDWDSFKENIRDKAMQMVDGYLNQKYETPLIPRINKDHSDDDYEEGIVMATAALTIYLLAIRRDPASSLAMAFYKIAINAEPAEGERMGILNKYLAGIIVRQDEVSKREVSSYNYWPDSSNTTDKPGLQLEGQYGGAQFEKWVLWITTGGAPGTAIYKLSTDGGTTYTFTDRPTKISDDLFVNLADGVRARFPAATYVQDDFWTIEVNPPLSTLEKPGSFATFVVER